MPLFGWYWRRFIFFKIQKEKILVIPKIGKQEKLNIKRWLKAKKYCKTINPDINGIISLAYFLTHVKATKHNAWELLFKHIMTHGGFIKNSRGIGKYSNGSFYKSKEWLAIRVKVLATSKECVLCGRGRKDGIVLHVDHIKPKSKYPKLALMHSNLQVLCADCNLGKSNNYEQDWR